MRNDTVFLIVTVGIKKNSYALKKYIYNYREPILKENQYAYRFRIKTNESDWKDRIIDTTLAEVKLPEHLLGEVETLLGKDIPTKMMDRLTQ